jgi:hypothetical protein
MNKQELLTYLANMNNPKVLGQHLEYTAADTVTGYNKYFAPLQTTYGKMPVLPSITLGLGVTLAQCKASLDFLNLKGFTYIHCDHHANNPWTGGDSWDTSNVNMAGLSTNANWLKELDKVKQVLLYAKSIGFTVIWRPFHEMNSEGGFWWDWGTAGKKLQPFKDAWHFMYNYLAECDVIWCYSVIDTNYTELYQMMAPMSNEFDLVGIDVYSDSATIKSNGYAILTSLGKPFGFSEAGPAGKNGNAATWLNSIKFTYPKTMLCSFWHTWDKCNAALANMSNIGTLINDAAILTTAFVVTPPIDPPPVDPPPVIILPTISTFTADKMTITKGNGTTLSWATKDATVVTLDGKTVSLNGSKKVYPSKTTAYVLIASNSSGNATKKTTVTVKSWWQFWL